VGGSPPRTSSAYSSPVHATTRAGSHSGLRPDRTGTASADVFMRAAGKVFNQSCICSQRMATPAPRQPHDARQCCGVPDEGLRLAAAQRKRNRACLQHCVGALIPWSRHLRPATVPGLECPGWTELWLQANVCCQPAPGARCDTPSVQPSLVPLGCRTPLPSLCGAGSPAAWTGVRPRLRPMSWQHFCSRFRS